jgi:NifU-like protein
MDFPKFQELVLNRTGFAQMADATATGEYFSDSCGDMYTFYLKVDGDQRLVDVSYFTIVTELAKGKTVDEAASISADDVENYLGGYPERKKDYPVRVLEALNVAIGNYRSKSAPTTAAESFAKIK